MPILKDGTIVVNNPQYGVGESAYTGFQEFRGLNITDKPGVCYPNKSLAKESATTVDGLIICMRIDPLTGIVYGISTDKFFKRTTSGVWSVITGHGATAANFFEGLEIWRQKSTRGSYIFLFHESGIDIYDSSGDESWTNNFKNAWETIGGGLVNKPTVIAQDRIYIANGTGQYGLSEIKENAGEAFEPDDSGTYTVTATKLDFPKINEGKCLAEIMGRVLIGTTIDFDDTKATIFPWDYINDATAYERPIELGVDTVWQMASHINRVYVHAGKRGNIFVTNGSLSADSFAKIPYTLSPSMFDDPDDIYLRYDAFKVWGNKLLFGWGGFNAGGSAGHNLGIYNINLSTGGIAIENIISTGEDGTSNYVDIGSILPLDTSTYLVSWCDDDGDTPVYGVDKLSTSGITGDKAYLIDQFYNVGTKKNPRTFKGIEIQLTKPLSTNDSVKVGYRTEQSGSFTNILTFNTSGKQSYDSIDHIDVKPPKDIESIQFQVILNNNAKLLYVRIY